MAAPISRPARSRRFIKVYLAIWAALALGALAYLAFLAFPHAPQQVAQRSPAAADAEGTPTLRAVAKSLAEMGVAVRRGFADVQKDVTHLKEVLVEQDGKVRAGETRLNALEERVATIEATRAPAPSPSAKPKPADKTPSPNKTSDARVTPHVINAPPAGERTPPPRPEPPIETGSISKAKDMVVFGEPVVTPTKAATHYGVQLAASPSVDGLRQRWEQLVDQHGALATLQPRVVEPKGGSGPYRLVAGPIETKADADRLCADMRVTRTSCFATPFAGSPL